MLVLTVGLLGLAASIGYDAGRSPGRHGRVAHR